jgi:hypothetical protein
MRNAIFQLGAQNFEFLQKDDKFLCLLDKCPGIGKALVLRARNALPGGPKKISEAEESHKRKIAELSESDDEEPKVRRSQRISGQGVQSVKK